MRAEGRRRRRVEASREKERRDESSRRRMPPDVTRPDRFPRQNPAPAERRPLIRVLPNKSECRCVKIFRGDFLYRETTGNPPGSPAAKVGPSVFQQKLAARSQSWACTGHGARR